MQKSYFLEYSHTFVIVIAHNRIVETEKKGKREEKRNS